MKEEVALFKALSDPIRLRLAVLLAIRGEICVCELAEALGEPSYKISKHLGILRAAGLVDGRRDGAWMHYRLTKFRSELEKCLQECFRDCLKDHVMVSEDLNRLDQSKCKECDPHMNERHRVLFLCTGNSCRSQMAEGWARHMKSDEVEPYSAGIEKRDLDPLAVKVMAEVGVDISGQKSKIVAELPVREFDYVVTLCDHASETCPVFPGKTKVVHVGFDDPPKLTQQVEDEEERLNHYRRVRDEIGRFVSGIPENIESRG